MDERMRIPVGVPDLSGLAQQKAEQEAQAAMEIQAIAKNIFLQTVGLLIKMVIERDGMALDALEMPKVVAKSRELTDAAMASMFPRMGTNHD
jgi:hypothetical protein